MERGNLSPRCEGSERHALHYAKALKLKVNEAKSAVARPQERKFLGFTFTDGPQIKRAIAPKAVDQRRLTIKSDGDEHHYCVACARIFLAADIKRLKALLARADEGVATELSKPEKRWG